MQDHHFSQFMQAITGPHPLKFRDWIGISGYLHISESNLYFDLIMICGVDVLLIGLKNDTIVFVPSTPGILEKNGLGAIATRN